VCWSPRGSGSAAPTRPARRGSTARPGWAPAHVDGTAPSLKNVQRRSQALVSIAALLLHVVSTPFVHNYSCMQQQQICLSSAQPEHQGSVLAA
jgi:hypothetical protein